MLNKGFVFAQAMSSCRHNFVRVCLAQAYFCTCVLLCTHVLLMCASSCVNKCLCRLVTVELCLHVGKSKHHEKAASCRHLSSTSVSLQNCVLMKMCLFHRQCFLAAILSPGYVLIGACLCKHILPSTYKHITHIKHVTPTCLRQDMLSKTSSYENISCQKHGC
jgi:hypothetical protein